MQSNNNRKLKVMHIISGDLWAGAETMACNLLRSLNTLNDIDLTVILLNEGRLAEELRNGSIPVHVIEETHHSFLEILKKIRTIIDRTCPAIIHSHRYKENLLAFLATRNNRGIKLVATQHGLPEAIASKPDIVQRLKSNLNFFILSRYFCTVAVSQDIQNFLINSYGFRAEKIALIHNGIELPSGVSIPLKNRSFVIGSSGRLFPVKDYPLMVEIAQIIATSGNTDIRFELAGDGPGRAHLESLIERYGLQSSFILRGHQDDMASFYSGLNLYMNTSIHEGIPMTILEALSHGLPVIAPAVGGIGEIYSDGVEGFLILGRGPQDFATRCLQLYEDREMRERMSSAARERTEQAFSAEKMAEEYYQVYRQ